MTCSSVAVLRMQAIGTPNDPKLSALVGGLSIGRSQFRRWWADRHVAQPDVDIKTIRHPSSETSSVVAQRERDKWVG